MYSIVKVTVKQYLSFSLVSFVICTINQMAKWTDGCEWEDMILDISILFYVNKALFLLHFFVSCWLGNKASCYSRLCLMISVLQFMNETYDDIAMVSAGGFKPYGTVYNNQYLWIKIFKILQSSTLNFDKFTSLMELQGWRLSSNCPVGYLRLFSQRRL